MKTQISIYVVFTARLCNNLNHPHHVCSKAKDDKAMQYLKERLETPKIRGCTWHSINVKTIKGLCLDKLW